MTDIILEFLDRMDVRMRDGDCICMHADLSDIDLHLFQTALRNGQHNARALRIVDDLLHAREWCPNLDESRMFCTIKDAKRLWFVKGMAEAMDYLPTQGRLSNILLTDIQENPDEFSSIIPHLCKGARTWRNLTHGSWIGILLVHLAVQAGSRHRERVDILVENSYTDNLSELSFSALGSILTHMSPGEPALELMDRVLTMLENKARLPDALVHPHLPGTVVDYAGERFRCVALPAFERIVTDMPHFIDGRTYHIASVLLERLRHGQKMREKEPSDRALIISAAPIDARFHKRMFAHLVATVCFALQPLGLPALLTVMIVDELFENDHRMWFTWQVVAKVKHFHDRC